MLKTACWCLSTPKVHPFCWSSQETTIVCVSVLKLIHPFCKGISKRTLQPYSRRRNISVLKNMSLFFHIDHNWLTNIFIVATNGTLFQYIYVHLWVFKANIDVLTLKSTHWIGTKGLQINLMLCWGPSHTTQVSGRKTYTNLKQWEQAAGSLQCIAIFPLLLRHGGTSWYWNETVGLR